MEELLLKLIEEVRKTYKDKKAADLVFKRLFAATKESSDYTEAYEFAKRAGHDLEDAIIENWAALMQDSEVFASTAKQLLKGVVPDMNEDILKACEQIQDNKNAAAGMRIKPQTAVANPYDLNTIAKGLDGKKMSALDGELATHACKTVASMERANMDFTMSSGYEIKVKRTYDGVGLRRKTKHAERCSYCLERAGSRTFKNSQAVNSSGIFARHEGCGCTIDYENQRTGTKSKDVQNFNTGKKNKTTKLRGNAENVEDNLEKARKDDIIKAKEKALIFDDRKLTKYSLDPVRCPDKAEAFRRALGIELKDAEYLKRAIYEALDLNAFVYLRTDKYGERYQQILKIKGLNGKVANVLTAWIKEGTSQKRLTSVYVDKEKRK